MGSLVIADVMPGLSFPKADCGSLLGLPTAQSAKRRLSESTEEVLKTINVIVDELLINVIAKRTPDEFASATREAFPKYAEMILAFERVAAAIVPAETLARLSEESLCELEADIRESGVASFGSDMRDRASFTAFTLRKIAERLEDVRAARAPEGMDKKDAEFAKKFLFNALQARFYIDLLVISMRTRHPLYPAVLPLVDNGLRSAVDAYAWVKRAHKLRRKEEPAGDFEIPALTAEEQELLDASMEDFAREDSA